MLIITAYLVTGCGSNTSEANNIKTNESKESETNKVEEEGEEDMELITVERFMEIYNFTEEELGDYDLQAMISQREITEKDTKLKDYREIVESYMEWGFNPGHNVAEIIYTNTRAASKDDDLNSMKWMVLDNAYNMETEVYFWDIENQKSYYANRDILFNYSDADIIKDLSDEEISNMITGLESIGWNEWKLNYPVEDPTEIDYYWDLYIVLGNDEVVRAGGIRPEEGGPEGFYEWLQMVIEISTEE
jgi:hypothetical protein